MVISTLERNQEENIFDYSTLDLSDPYTLLEMMQKLRQIVVQEGQDLFNRGNDMSGMVAMVAAFWLKR
jgi:pyruvate kinase